MTAVIQAVVSRARTRRRSPTMRLHQATPAPRDATDEHEYDTIVVEVPVDDPDDDDVPTVVDAIPTHIEPEKTRPYYFPAQRLVVSTSTWGDA